MKLIPVVDLKGGLVVAARLGERHRYAPIRTPLCASAEPLAVVAALLDACPGDTLYLADLDAIGGGPCQFGLIEHLHRRHPAVSLWVDNGLTDLDRLSRLARPVIGSESLVDLEQAAELSNRLAAPILSLDYRAEGFLGPSGLERRPELWPREVILMSLPRVGSGQGPDLERLARLRRLAPERHLFAAGGVRDRADLSQLAALGISGALVSTALHQGHLAHAGLGAA